MRPRFHLSETTQVIQVHILNRKTMAKAKTLGAANVPHKALHSRISFLYQAAAYLATQERPLTLTTSTEDEAELRQGHQKAGNDNTFQHATPIESQPTSSQILSRQMLSDLRSVSHKMLIRLSPAMKHTICKRCDTLLVDGSTCITEVENKSKNGKKPWADVLVRKCTTCGCERRFPVNVDRQPRRPDRVSKSTGPQGG